MSEGFCIEDFRGLRDRDYAARGLLVLEGRILVEKALQAGLRIEAALCVPGDEAAWLERSGGDYPVLARPSPEIEAIAGYPFHRGVLALARRPELPALRQGLVPPVGHILVLWNVTDAENLGLLARSAAALGASALALGPHCADPFSRKALRAGMGNTLGLPLFLLEKGDLPLLRGKPQQARLLVAAALGPNSVNLDAMAEQGKVALILGNEGFGLPDEVVAACDLSVLVPMAEGVDSLNVAACGAIMMWELFRKRQG